MIIINNVYCEGYWREKKNSNKKLPYPKSEKEKINQKFIEKLLNIQKIAHITTRNKYDINHFTGELNGNKEYNITYESVDLDIKKIKWTEGLIIYYIHHNVHPSNEFYDFVMDYKIRDEHNLLTRDEKKLRNLERKNKKKKWQLNRKLCRKIINC